MQWEKGRFLSFTIFYGRGETSFQASQLFVFVLSSITSDFISVTLFNLFTHGTKQTPMVLVFHLLQNLYFYNFDT